MTSDRFQQVERLYFSALKRDASERAAFLREACAGDEALLKEVEALLEYGPRAQRFMETAALEMEARAMARDRLDRLQGKVLGAYEIIELLGRGGMGEVYRAQDTRLKRTVAVKILPEHLSRDRLSRERFEREARTASAINHPHICSIYDVGEQDGIFYLVMEYIEGETLAYVLSRSRVPMEPALRLAGQMASALAAAHSRGIIHRDFKPGNVMITSSGPKILDFGLAKRQGDFGGEASTMTELTQEGMIVGTLHYMSPEQAEGKQVDSRSDIFSFGVVLHEMLTGTKSFLRDSPASTISAILRDEPPPLEQLLPAAPAALSSLVSRCVRKEPARRAQSMADIAVQLEEIREDIQRGGSRAQSQQPQLPAGRRLGLRWAIAAGLLAIGLSLGFILTRFRQPEVGQRPVQFKIYPPPGAEFGRIMSGGIALSPDGKLLAFIARYQGNSRLWVRPLDALAARELPGTDNAHHPFWSPDGRSLGFFAGGKLKRVDVSGTSVQELCDSSLGSGGTWNSDDTILFSKSNYDPLYRVSVAGGLPEQATTLDTAAGERSHRWPQFLPDGRRFVYFVRAPNSERAGIYLSSLDSDLNVRVFNAASNALYAAPIGNHQAHLLWVRDGRLMARAFDPGSGGLTGDTFAVAAPIGLGQFSAFGEFAVSKDGGTLVYTGGPALSQLTWVSMDGRFLEKLGQPAPYESLHISPDGKSVAVERNQDIWLIEIARPIETRFTFAPSHAPVWSRDGQWIAYRGFRNGVYNLFRKHAVSGAQEERLTETDSIQGPDDWSLDSRILLYSDETSGNWNIYFRTFPGNGAPTPVAATAFAEQHGQLSPDGNWIAYSSGESGRTEVYVQSFPKGNFKRQISNAGGDLPRWRKFGQLIYMAPDGKLMSVTVEPRAGVLTFSAPRVLFTLRFRSNAAFGYSFDVAPDGDRLLVLEPVEEAGSASLKVILNWQATLR